MYHFLKRAVFRKLVFRDDIRGTKKQFCIDLWMDIISIQIVQLLVDIAISRHSEAGSYCEQPVLDISLLGKMFNFQLYLTCI